VQVSVKSYSDCQNSSILGCSSENDLNYNPNWLSGAGAGAVGSDTTLATSSKFELSRRGLIL